MNSTIDSKSRRTTGWITRGCATLLCLGMLAPASHAQSTWEVAPGRTKIGFEASHLVFLKVKGKFKQFEGYVTAGRDDFTDAVAEMAIPVDSIHTGIKNRDNDLQGEHFFHAEEHPHLFFISSAFQKNADGTYTVTGDLTMRGTTLPVELLGTFGGVKEISRGRMRADFSLTGAVNRFDYGLRWKETDEADKLLVGEEIILNIDLVLIKNPE